MRRDSDHGVLPRRARRLALARAGMRIVGDCTTHEQLIAIAASTRKVRVLVVGGNRWKAEVRAARLAGAAESLPGEVDLAYLVEVVAALARAQDRRVPLDS
jgi:DNA-binding NarL/FixJ family response regulator